jgi:hypothetical protein
MDLNQNLSGRPGQDQLNFTGIYTYFNLLPCLDRKHVRR